MDQMTFEKYIQNPTNSRSRLVGEADVAKSVYNNKYNKMILHCAGNVNYMMWKATDLSRYIIYFAMPSEDTERLFYDVVIEFTTDDDVEKRSTGLKGYKVRFFSNDPSFIFTYAHAYNKRGLLIESLRNKISSKALKEEPKVTNPNMLAGYVKSFYFAYIYMSNKGLFNRLAWLNALPISGFNKWASANIVHSDRKLEYAQNLKKLAKQKGRGTPGFAKIRVSKADNNVVNAVKTLDNAAKMSKKVGEVKKANIIRAKNNSRNSLVKITKRTGK